MEIEMRKFCFLFGCVPVRFIMALSLLVMPPELVTLAASALALIGVSFAVLYMFKLRLNAPEGGGKTWWNYLRPLHAVLYLLAAHLLLTGNRGYASMVLIIDVIVGMVSGYYDRWGAINKQKMKHHAHSPSFVGV